MLNREDSLLYFPPEAFGPFRVLHQIGAGTLGPIFRGYEQAEGRRDRLVAIKVFRLDLTPEQVAALVDHFHALIAADIRHPHIAAPIAAGVEGSAPYLAQEYAVGDSLDVVLRERGPLTIQEGVSLVEALAGAIDHAAARGVHHGSLHPRDILLSADGVRITGFGVADALARVSARLPTRPQYSSPDGPSDVYSLGAIAFEAVTGKRMSPESITEFENAHGAELRRAFGVALMSNSEIRPDRAADFGNLLRDAAQMTAERGGDTGANRRPPDTAEAFALDSPADIRIQPSAEAVVERDLPLERHSMGASEHENLADSMAQGTPIRFPQTQRSVPVRSFHLEPEVFIESRPRRWPIAVGFLGIALATAFAVVFFLRTPRPVAGQRSSVAPAPEGTTVDLPPAAAPAPSKSETPSPAPASPASATPAPAPSRPASGAVAPLQRLASGGLLIRSTPADAEVLLNGRVRGKTPLAVRDLELGSYTIRVARDGYAADQQTVELTAQRPSVSTTFDLRPISAARAASLPGRQSGVGSISVRSRPAGARVLVNDRLAGSTPLAIPELPAGPATVRIELDGYQPWVTTVTVTAGEQAKVAASLERP